MPLPLKYWPFVTAAAKLFLAACAVVPPVPPLAIATVPVTLAAVPVVFWFSVGTSPAAKEAPTVTRPFASTVTLVYVPATTPELASVPVPVTLAEPLKLPLVYVRSPVMAMVRPVVSVAAEPVVFWFSVGTSAATIARNVGAPATPLGAAKKVLAVWLAKFAGMTESVPPNVRFPLVVTVPLRVRPLTVPVPPTDVTVPVVLDVPAPIAVRKSAAFRDETVLSALKRGNVTALGFVIVNRFAPSVVAPSAVRAAAAVVEPVPPLAIATVPVTFAAVPVVFWLPAVLTPGKLMLADPLKLTPPMVLAVCKVVAVVAFPLRAAVMVPALKLPEASLATMVLLVLALVALDVTVKVEAPA